MSDATPVKLNGLLHLLEVLVRHDVRFVICGGVACVLHGISRATQDIDVCVEMEEENLRRLIDAVSQLGMRPRIPEPMESLLDSEKRRSWIEERHARVFTIVSLDSPVQLDVFLMYSVDWDDLLRDAVTMRPDGFEVLVSSIEHLIEAKRAVNPPRKVDLRDIEDLQELMTRDQTREP